MPAGPRYKGMMEAVAAVPPFERFYVEHRDVVLGFLRRRLGATSRRGRFPGDVPARAARLRPARARRAPARVGADDRGTARDRQRAAARSPSPDELPELPVEDGRPAYAEIEHLADGLPPTERAAVVLRYAYDLPYDDIAARSARRPEAARQAASSGVRRLRGEEGST